MGPDPEYTDILHDESYLDKFQMGSFLRTEDEARPVQAEKQPVAGDEGNKFLTTKYTKKLQALNSGRRLIDGDAGGFRVFHGSLPGRGKLPGYGR